MMTRFPRSQSSAAAISLWMLASINAAVHPQRSVPQPQRYAELLARARAGTLRINHGEAPEPFFGLRARRGPSPEVVPAKSYRAAAKTSFAAGTARTFTGIPALFGPLPSDAAMTEQFPALVRRTNNTSPRVAMERRNVKVPAWIYWIALESDHDFHVILGSTAQFGTGTVFMNSEVSGLPSANPTRSPFPQRRAGIRAILANHENANGLFVHPVRVAVTGSLLWDGEHRAPNTVGPEGLQPTKAWEIHPIRGMVER